MNMLVFQYGSNISASRLNAADRLNGGAKPVSLARTVANWLLAFEVWSATNKCAAANLRLGGTSPVWGRLYEIPDYLIDRNLAKRRNRKSLDQVEGEGKSYVRARIEVLPVGNKEPVQPMTYLAKTPRTGIRTSQEYVEHILVGLAEVRCSPRLRRAPETGRTGE